MPVQALGRSAPTRKPSASLTCRPQAGFWQNTSHGPDASGTITAPMAEPITRRGPLELGNEQPAQDECCTLEPSEPGRRGWPCRLCQKVVDSASIGGLQEAASARVEGAHLGAMVLLEMDRHGEGVVRSDQGAEGHRPQAAALSRRSSVHLRGDRRAQFPSSRSVPGAQASADP